MKRVPLVPIFLAATLSLASQTLNGQLSSKSIKTYSILRADSLFLASNFDLAFSEYRGVLESKPSPQLIPLIHLRIAKIFVLKNEVNKAFDELNAALKAGYTNLNELETAKEFNTIRKDPRFRAVIGRATENAFPCMKDSLSRAFDFWVGEWEAFVTGTNDIAGYSVIQKASGDCMILENWSSILSPFNGKSINFVDPKSGKWEQVWVGSNGGGNHVGRFYNGEYKNRVMQFDFEGVNPQGQKYIGRFRFFNEGPNKVRQLSETSTDEGNSWTTNYDFIYIRRK